MHESPLYAGIDLHSNNSVLSILDETDHVVYERRLKNRLGDIVAALEPFRDRITAVAVESTFNWYWLVDGLMDEGYDVRLVNTAAVGQYDGIKFTDDRHDARKLAHMKRLGILPEGYIMPRELRAIRDLLRKRLRLVQQRTANILSLQNLKQRNEGVSLTVRDIRSLTPETVAKFERDEYRAMAMRTTLEVIISLDGTIDKLEKAILKAVRPREEWRQLKTIWGVGNILAMTIYLESGPIDRFASPGRYTSYSRLVPSKRMSNGKKKGVGNQKCGNRYLCWAWVEAANFAIRSYPIANRFYHRKTAKTLPVVGRKALAHKLARAGWHVMRTGEPFNPNRVFS